ncbi:hypothetical protein F0170_16815 [Pseudomonas sp. MAFF 730085]|uniref:DUF1799 domain-containing protein n=1 Tax=Pseudomonas kitaguniensis TaxID=2607908 RepID=A0A5N7JVS9_9PSED|nr:hypothetical protein [Pseudomonas kitaguniensis]
MYEPPPSAEQLAAFGLDASDMEEAFEVWPCVWPAFRLFDGLSTQWRTGACGATGIDYTAITSVAELIGMKKKQLREIFPDLQIMEAEALLVMSEQSK